MFLYLGVTIRYVWSISIGKPLRWLGYATLNRFELSLSFQKRVKMAPKKIIKLLFWQICFHSARSRVYLVDFKFYLCFPKSLIRYVNRLSEIIIKTKIQVYKDSDKIVLTIVRIIVSFLNYNFLGNLIAEEEKWNSTAVHK